MDAEEVDVDEWFEVKFNQTHLYLYRGYFSVARQRRGGGVKGRCYSTSVILVLYEGSGWLKDVA